VPTLGSKYSLSEKGRDSAETTLWNFIIPPSYWIKFHRPMAAEPLCLLPDMATAVQTELAQNLMLVSGIIKLVPCLGWCRERQWFLITLMSNTAKMQWLSVSIVWVSLLARWKYELRLRGKLIIVCFERHTGSSVNVCPTIYYEYSARHL